VDFNIDTSVLWKIYRGITSVFQNSNPGGLISEFSIKFHPQIIEPNQNPEVAM
jgi:hypothetical protein